MSGTNALSYGDSGRGSFLNLLAQSDVANPLAAIQAGTQAASATYDLRQKQANQAIGQILQQSTDENGNVDYGQAQKLAANAGPVVQAGMQDMLKNNAALQNQQTLNTAGRMKLIAGSAMTIANDPSDANVNASFDALASQGVPAGQIAQERARWLAMSPDQRKDEAMRHGLFALDQLHQVVGQTTGQDVGGQYQGLTVTQPGLHGQRGGIVGGSGVTTGPPVGPTVSTKLPVDDQGVIPLDANGNPTRPPKRWDDFAVPVQKVPGMPTGGQPVPAPGSNAGAPGSNAPPPPPPGATIRSPGAYPGKRSDIPSSSQVASADNSVVPSNVGTAAAPSGAVAGDVAAIQGGMAGAAATPSTGTQTAQLGPYLRTGAPQGQPEKLKADVEAYTNDQANYPNVQTRAQNMAHAYDALMQLKSATGKGAAGINDLRSYAQTLGILPSGAVNEQKLFEIVNKYTERAMIEAAGGSTTDMGRRMQEQANAGTLLSTPANLDILRNDMGKTLQAMAAYKEQSDKSGAGYLDTRANVADKTDPRGFVWNLYSPDEQAAINVEVAKDKTGTAATKLHKAIGMAQRLQLQIPGLSTGPQSQAAPSPASNGGPAAAPNPVAGAPANALAMATPVQTNALAA